MVNLEAFFDPDCESLCRTVWEAELVQGCGSIVQDSCKFQHRVSVFGLVVKQHITSHIHNFDLW